MLRAFTAAGQAQPDLDAQYLERSRLLADKMKVGHASRELEYCSAFHPPIFIQY